MSLQRRAYNEVRAGLPPDCEGMEDKEEIVYRYWRLGCLTVLSRDGQLPDWPSNEVPPTSIVRAARTEYFIMRYVR